MLRAMADAPAYLPVIRTLTKPDGSSILPVDELRIMPSLVATRVVDDGPDRIELSVYTAPAVDTRPFTPVVLQPGVTTGTAESGATRTILAFAGVGGPSTFTGAVLFAGGAVTANNTDFASYDIWECNGITGAHVGAAKVSGTTKIAGANATGDWVGGAPSVDVGLGFDIASGNYLAVEWATNNGAGVDMPGGWWRIT